MLRCKKSAVVKAYASKQFESCDKDHNSVVSSENENSLKNQSFAYSKQEFLQIKALN